MEHVTSNDGTPIAYDKLGSDSGLRRLSRSDVERGAG
jgi:hypothetical protein